MAGNSRRSPYATACLISISANEPSFASMWAHRKPDVVNGMTVAPLSAIGSGGGMSKRNALGETVELEIPGGVSYRPGIRVDRSIQIMRSPGTMPVVLRNTNSTLSMNQFEVYDNVGEALVGIFTLKGGQSLGINIFQDSRGMGSIKIRNLDLVPNRWERIDSIKSGDVINA